jgi:hypothetical protein
VQRPMGLALSPASTARCALTFGSNTKRTRCSNHFRFGFVGLEACQFTCLMVPLAELTPFHSPQPDIESHP